MPIALATIKLSAAVKLIDGFTKTGLTDKAICFTKLIFASIPVAVRVISAQRVFFNQQLQAATANL
ncbi:MAG: hypothetical protein K0S11_1112 [Gammaproteobacteria bacterium]|jgi:hypothetical protein|nr:hypothetical protein [Gammaproteobacteria bacterium]